MQTYLDTLLRALLPAFSTLCLDNCELNETTIVLVLSTAAYPACGYLSGRVRSRYWRSFPISPGQISRCACICIYANSPVPLRPVYSVSSPNVSPKSSLMLVVPRRQAAQVRMGLAVGGKAGSRLSRELHLHTSAVTLLGQECGIEEPSGALPTMIGVDDWTFRNGVCYGTLLVDLQTIGPRMCCQTGLQLLFSHG